MKIVFTKINAWMIIDVRYLCKLFIDIPILFFLTTQCSDSPFVGFRFSIFCIVHCIPALLVATSWFQKNLPVRVSDFIVHSLTLHPLALRQSAATSRSVNSKWGLANSTRKSQQHLQMPVRLLSTGYWESYEDCNMFCWQCKVQLRKLPTGTDHPSSCT